MISRLRIELAVACAVLVVAAALLAGSQTRSDTHDAPAGAQLRVNITHPGTQVVDDLLGLGNRLVFSTVAFKPRAEQRIALHNATTSDMRVTSLNFAGGAPNAFALGDKQSLTTRIHPGKEATIRVRFTPTKVGVQQTTLIVHFDNRESVDIDLGGLNAADFEGKYEPNLQQIFDALGYRVDVAMPKEQPSDINVPAADRGNSISAGSQAVGDEVLAPYFRQADVSKPVRLIPVAAYISRSTELLGPFGINAPHDGRLTEPLLSMRGGADEWGGQNQQLLPGIGNGNFDALEAVSKTSFTPSGSFATFGLWDGTRLNYSDDSLNKKAKTSPNGQHNVRIYPAKSSNGEVIPNRYLAAFDSGSPDYKNYDYQDFVFLLSNVKPAA